MQRRILPRCRGRDARVCCHFPIRECSSSKAEAAGSARAAKEAVDVPTDSSAARPPTRKDWRTHKEVVFVKGVPMKGPLLKLPWKEQFLICAIFSITGGASIFFVRPLIQMLISDGFLGLPEDSSLMKGPWLFRLLYISITFPAYSFVLFVVGSLFGRRVWFSFMIHKMWSRFLTRRGGERLKYLLDIRHY
ncbi:hypothetical protein TRVL_00313 [Trypanosoma vivax]|uniref:DUF6787 domain-containing protein n=1 Tax=Trypanosoma vivax (strain Y486) TaxID=1055687 RepID=G0U4Q2_TRYVY|nr:hypothetical protein TRVL_00313 [Trypanosoma vivax]CCC52416.1 conserved hypothetical protein [Trypanosoma vivax Y486]